jgi:hypothetical protein
MAIFAPIPLPRADNPQFKDVMDYFEQIKERKMKEPLMAAQAQEAQASAAKSNMIANLIRVAYGGGSGAGQSAATQGAQNLLGAQDIASPTPQAPQIAQSNQNPQAAQIGQIPASAASTNAPVLSSMGASPVASMQQTGAQIPQQNAQASPVLQQPEQPTGGQLHIPGIGLAPSPANSDQQRAQSILYSLGILKETPAQEEAREERTNFQKALAGSNVKALDNWNDILTSNNKILPVLENIQDISSNPAFQAMYKNPEYFGYNLSYLKRFGTPEQQKLLTSLGTNAKSIFQAMGQEFKGAFREYELKLFNKAAPDEINDTIQQIIAKTNTAMAIRTLISRRLSLAANIVASSSGRILPGAALEIAERQINGRKVIKEIEDHYNQLEAEAKIAKDKTVKQNENASSGKNVNAIPVQNAVNASGTTTLVDPSGNEYIIASDKKAAALAKFPDLKEKGVNP